MDWRNGIDDLKPKGFFLRKFHYERLEIENYVSGLGDAKRIRWAVHGFISGIVVTALPFFDWPRSQGQIVLDWPVGLGGIAFSATGFVLAGFSLFMMIRRANIKEAQDNQRVIGRDGDLAP